MSQYSYYPASSGGSGSNASVSTNNAAIPGSSTLVAGKSPTTTLVPMSVDASGNLNVNVLSGGGSNSSVGVNAAAIPGSSTLVGGKNGSGNLVPLLVDAAGALSVNVLSGGGSNSSVGTIAATVPTTATFVGGRDTSNNLRGIAVSTTGVLILPVGASTESTQVGVYNNTLGIASLVSSTEAAAAIAAPTRATQLGGYDGSNFQIIRATNIGELQVNDLQLDKIRLAYGPRGNPLPTNSVSMGAYDTGSGNLDSLTMTTGALNVAIASAVLPTNAATETTLATLNGKMLTQAANFGAAANGIRVAALVGNASGVADFGTGAVSAQTIRVIPANEATQDLSVTGQAAQTAVVNNILTVASGAAATDLTGYRSATIQVVSTGTSGTFIFEGSNDNTNFQTVPVWNQLILTGTPIVAAITATASTIIYTLPIGFRYLRLRIATLIGGGSIQAFSKFSQTSWTPGILQVAQSTAANLNATVTATNLSTNVAQMNAVTVLMGAGVTGTGSQRTTIATCATGTITSVAASITSVSILASSATRRGATLYNESTSVAYVAFSATSSVTAYTVQIAANGYYELPGPNVYSGAISCIWATANGNMRITDIS